MRLLFVTPTPPDRDDRDGMTQIAFRLIPELARQHMIDVWTLHDSDQVIRIPAARETRVFPQTTPSIVSHYLGPRHWPYFLMRHESPALHQALRELQPNAYDLIVIHSPFMTHYLPDVQIPAVVHVFDALSDWFPKAAEKESNIVKRAHLRAEGRAALQIEQAILPQAKALVVVSETDAATLQHTTPMVPTTIIPIGIDTTTLYPPTTPRDPATVVLTGVMSYPPNIDAATWFVAEVWPSVVEQHPQAKLRIVGKDPARAVQALSSATNVTVTGRVPSMAEELRRATVAVSPLRFGTGYKIKVNEALACGAPLVASPVSLPGTGVIPNQHCLVAENTAEWIAHVTLLLRDASRRTALSEQAVTFAATRAWPKIAEQYEHVYAAVTK